MREYEELQHSIAYMDFLYDHYDYVKEMGLGIAEAMEEGILFNHFLMKLN